MGTSGSFRDETVGCAMTEAETKDPAAAANYVAELTASLAIIARKHGFDTLGYILDMARLEAESASRHAGGSNQP